MRELEGGAAVGEGDGVEGGGCCAGDPGVVGGAEYLVFVGDLGGGFSWSSEGWGGELGCGDERGRNCVLALRREG